MGKNKSTGEYPDNPDAKRILHELQVHQAELEMQSEELRRTLDELSESESKYRMLFDNAGDAIFIHDAEGRIVSVNRTACERLGYTHAELLSMRVNQVDSPEEGRHAPERISRLMEQGQHSFETVHQRKDCSLVPTEVSARRITWDGQPAMMSLCRDITKRKQIAQRLQENEIRLRTLVQTIPDLIWLKDPDGVYLSCNSMFERFFGAREADIVGKTDYDFVDRELADFFREHDRKAMEAGGPTSNEEWITFADNGQQVLLETIKTPMCDSEGKLFGVLGIARDITERRRAEEKNLELERKFQQTQKLESLGVLAGGIAHDFNNILSIIQGYCYILFEDINSGSDSKAHLRQIEQAAGRAADLCRQMLSYAGETTLQQTSVNLVELVAENVKMLRSAISKNVTFALDLTDDLPEITGDIAQIQQVVMNLIINAAEAIGDRNGTVRIGLKAITVQPEQVETDFLGDAIPAGNYACLTVADNGCGMDPETRQRIFEPFFTTKFTGRGLGMSAVLGIIRLHHGSLQLSSTAGAGTTFRVCFPSPALPATVKSAPTPVLDSITKGSGTILLVDDEEALLVIGSILLKALGFSAITATNGREALDILHEQGSVIDLILLDMIMPEMGGIETYRSLRQLSRSMPVVICSGYHLDKVLDELESDQHAAVIQKPFKPEQLQATLLKLLENTE